MLDTVYSSLKKLEKSFMLSYKEVTKETEYLKDALENFNGNNGNVKLSKSEVLNIAKTIEKLSINNEYKLNLIRDFPEYFSNIKYRKK
mgnify:CR=1 FL=1|tara:strand:+ start:65 stop:328 length:264 start_codon:yes stop_codon:yes gene_type:complete